MFSSLFSQISVSLSRRSRYEGSNKKRPRPT
jgi:hypothetical protein